MRPEDFKGWETWQKEILEDDSHTIVLAKARQVGGTLAFMDKVFEALRDQKDVAVYTPTYNSTRQTIKQGLDFQFDRFVNQGPSGYFSETAHRLLNHKDEYDVIFVDQAAWVDQDTLMKLADSTADLWICGTPTPNRETTTFQALFESEISSSYQVRMADTIHLKSEYVDRMRDQTSGELQASEVNGEFDGDRQSS